MSERTKLGVSGAFSYVGPKFSDHRGFYQEIEFPAETQWVLQCGHSLSKRDVVRGLKASPYAKLVTCFRGEMWVVIVDLRPDSETALKWESVTVTAQDRTHLYVPAGVGLGFLAKDDNTVAMYFKELRFQPSAEIEVNCFDKELGIPWPAPQGSKGYVMSDKDRGLPGVHEALLRARQPLSHLEGEPLIEQRLPATDRGKYSDLRISGAFVYYGPTYRDERGFFEEIEVPMRHTRIVQSGHAGSAINVVRGMHCSPYAKIVSCLSGKMWDVLLDLRPRSPTYMTWDSVVLNSADGAHVYVPPGVGHGYMSLENDTVTLYMKEGKFKPGADLEVNCFDPAVKIDWPKPIGAGAEYIISDKDRKLPSAAEVLATRMPSSPESSPMGNPQSNL